VWIIILWATCEEVFKFVAAYLTGLRQKEDDEPVDQIIYLVTAALGFAALENALYVFNDLYYGNTVITSFMTGNTRFIGATLLHIISSASIGVFLGLSFYKSKLSKFIHLGIGLVVASGLHTAFNLLIIKSEDNTAVMFTTFYFVWISIIVLLLCFEKVKNVTGVNKNEQI
jgi:RsiW-degrading membrane proteinase PrsW (M82 family)